MRIFEADWDCQKPRFQFQMTAQEEKAVWAVQIQGNEIQIPESNGMDFRDRIGFH